MSLINIFLLAFAPGIFWLWLIYWADRYHPEPRWLIIRTFLLGAAVAIPIAIIEFILYPASMDNIDPSTLSVGTLAYLAFVVAGVTEELGKFLVVKQTLYKSAFFDEPYDGIEYSAAAALGFASLENVGYLLSFGWDTILLRGFFSVVAHVLFAAVWGYSMATSKVRHGRTRLYVWFWLVVSMAAHGLFDFLLFSHQWYTLLIVPLFIGAVVIYIGYIKRANRISQRELV